MSISIVKIGGNVIDEPKVLAKFLSDFASLPSPKVLVHGGGKLATRLSQKLEFPTRMIEGRRVTDAETLKVVTMVYAGLVNKQIIASLQSLGCNAIGLSGADANIIPAKRRSATPIDYGFVGDIDPRDIHSDTIVTLLKSGITPVFCALTHDGQGSMLNSNADSVASALAVALSAHDTAQLVYCFEQRGVLKDLNDPESLISVITPDVYQDLRSQGIVSKGMIPKIDNAFNAIRHGVSSVVIKHSDNLKNNIGTTIKMS